ncbi:hypothetical protein KYB31_07420 [Clostridium felsineum]|uniref:DUF5685 family protein n=1 Tax=Clostridium felsineum TaxID=36839 RepID=UPI00214D9DD5|nr:DUF5685 family protein [Clostridium felsineum]MCR3758823.1 hypothetical protein [Clostridium felsineum]
MFGYVLPLKGELKIKDYEKFKSYYCGLCLSIKKNYGNLPRCVLNYDMTFLAVLLDALEDKKCEFSLNRCIAHPTKKKYSVVDNDALDYAAFFNICLVYFKLIDDVNDDKKLVSKLKSILLKGYFKKFPKTFSTYTTYIKNSLAKLSKLEKSSTALTLDEISHPFADLTAFIISSYAYNKPYKDILYNIGYNLGKWIYIIDAFDDLKEDLEKQKFNAINVAMNLNNKPYEELIKDISPKISFVLTMCGSNCLHNLNLLPLKTNQDILFNILQYGLLDRMNNLNL